MCSISFVLGEGVGLCCSNDCSIYVYNIDVWTDGASAQKSEQRGSKPASRVRMHPRRNGETDRATGVGARQGWDGDESNVSKLKMTVGRGKGFIWLSWLEYMVWVGYMVYGIG